MSDEIYLIDAYSHKDSVIHRASHYTKAIFLVMSLAMLITSASYVKIALFCILILILITLAKLPVTRLVLWSAYMLIFGLLFALVQLFTSPFLSGLILLRTFSTTLLAVFTLSTTPSLLLFSMIPSRTLRNVFFLTYRFFFMMVSSFTDRLSMMKVRGINSASLKRKISAAAFTIGHGVIHAIEKADRVYRIMVVRGFSGNIEMLETSKLNKYDALYIPVFAVVVILWLI